MTENELHKRINHAVEIGISYGQIDGSHHRLWVIDQMLRELLGKDYEETIELSNEDGEYEWDCGVAP